MTDIEKALQNHDFWQKLQNLFWDTIIITEKLKFSILLFQ